MNEKIMEDVVTINTVTLIQNQTAGIWFTGLDLLCSSLLSHSNASLTKLSCSGITDV